MRPDILEVAAAQFCSLSPTLIVWLGGALLCAYQYERAPRRFIALGCLLGVMVVGSVSLPFMQYIAMGAASNGFTSLTSISLVMGLIGAVGTTFLTIIPPIALVLIGLLTPSPPPVDP